MTSEGSTQTAPIATNADPEGPARPAEFRDVLAAEWTEIRNRRRIWSDPERATGGTPGEAAAEEAGPPPDLAGIALSGGGIRSATFGLGLLQRLAEQGLLRHFDYLSTVSGGGYTGGWFSAWLSRDDRPPREIFPPEEGIEAERWETRAGRRDAVAEGEAPAPAPRGRNTPPDASPSASAGDPIHRLRLFANYLTPRKGLLSADSWRAATVVSRNLVLTWLVLLPVLLAMVVAAQVYFTLAVDPASNFVREFPVAAAAPDPAGARAAPPAEAVADEAALRAQAELARERAAAAARESRTTAIRERAAAAARPLIVLFAWLVVLTLVWMVHGSRGGLWTLLAALAGAVVALGIGWTVSQAIGPGGGGGTTLTRGWWFVLGAGALILVVVCWARPQSFFDPRPNGAAEKTPSEDLLRNRVVRAHGAILVGIVASAALLLVAGFSHDIAWFLFDPDSGGPLPGWVKQMGGWGAVVASVGAMVFTGYMGAPAGGDGQSHARPRLPTRLVFAVAPVLAIALLAVLAAMAGRWLIAGLGDPGVSWTGVGWVVLLAVLLFLAFAVYEAYDACAAGGQRKTRASVATAAGVAASMLVFLPFYVFQTLSTGLVLWHVVLGVSVAWAILLVGLNAGGRAAVGARSHGRGGGLPGWLPRRPTSGAGHLVRGAVMLAVALGGWIVALLIDPAIGGTQHISLRPDGSAGFDFTTGGARATPLLLALAVGCGVFAAAERRIVASPRRRALALVTVALVALSALAILPHLPLEAARIRYSAAAVLVVVLALAWVVGLGWMANPNMLSLHAFYRARLVRAYLGASNPNRQKETITESVVGDDLPLQSLRNCEVGAPYQLINTTLNLVGGRDLATAQRSAESFLMSKLYCGSARTRYRRTSEYMGGTLTLGTAVAISGAATSPNMGSQTPTAALSMLLALLNVRLAFWAPTPNRPFWRDSRARLWPYYVLRELLSQTHELSAYCCLSDGGHFDNTGLYSLVERGCRYIVLSDCGADPEPCFQDLGNAIRRCRIDFGTEIDLRIDSFIPARDSRAAAHFVVGTITYSRAHARALGWPEPITDEQLQGKIIWIKPSLTMTDEPADLRQYAIQNPAFPQQPTGDQWYDEAQFESYRRLGRHSAEQVFAAVKSGDETVPALFARVAEDVEARPAAHFNLDVTTIDGKQVLRVVETPSAAGST